MGGTNKKQPLGVVFCCADSYAIRMKYESVSAMETKKIAKLFAEELLATKTDKKAFVIAFKGDLGAGKTTFIQGLMRGLGVKKRIMSPTFTLLRSYAIKTDSFERVHHFDCYRITEAEEMKELKFKDMLNDPKAIILIEWPERIAKLLPRNKVTVALDYGETINKRTIEIK